MTIRTKQFWYKTRVQWKEARRGILAAEGKPDLEIATPPEFKGHEGIWTPEDLFVAAVNSCIMTTFLGTAYWKKLRFDSFECEAEGLLERPGEEFLFTKIIVRPRVTLPPDGDEELARWVLDFAEKDCLISHSIKTDVAMEPEIIKSTS